MQKHILKFLMVISMIFLVSLCLLEGNVLGTEEPQSSDEVVVGNEATPTNNEEADSNTSNENRVDNNTAQNTSATNQTSNETTNEDVYTTNQSTSNATTTSSNSGTTSTGTSSMKQIDSYRTVDSLPEANLGLNNILNVILIAIGIVIILLAIAILIRLK